jgi:putative NADH-flavin reductase
MMLCIDMHYYPPFDFYFSPTDKVHPELFKLKTKAFRVIVDSFATDTTGKSITSIS